jgi:hypothetical protein
MSIGLLSPRHVLGADPQRGRPHDLLVVRAQRRLDQLHALAVAQDARAQLERRERHRPQQLVRDPHDVQRDDARDALDGARDQRRGRAAVLRPGVPRTARQLRRHEAV